MHALLLFSRVYTVHMLYIVCRRRFIIISCFPIIIRSSGLNVKILRSGFGFSLSACATQLVDCIAQFMRTRQMHSSDEEKPIYINVNLPVNMRQMLETPQIATRRKRGIDR